MKNITLLSLHVTSFRYLPKKNVTCEITRDSVHAHINFWDGNFLFSTFLSYAILWQKISWTMGFTRIFKYTLGGVDWGKRTLNLPYTPEEYGKPAGWLSNFFWFSLPHVRDHHSCMLRHPKSESESPYIKSQLSRWAVSRWAVSRYTWYGRIETLSLQSIINHSFYLTSRSIEDSTFHFFRSNVIAIIRHSKIQVKTT